jgi:hypothetical protein
LVAQELTLEEQFETKFTTFWRTHQTVVYVDRYSSLGRIEVNDDEVDDDDGAAAAGAGAAAGGGGGGGERSSQLNLRGDHLIPFSPLNPSRQLLRLLSGQVAEELHAGVTHVLVDPNDTARFDQVDAYVQRGVKKLKSWRLNPFVPCETTTW